MDCIVLIGSFPQSLGCIRGGVEASVYGLAKALSATHEVHVFDLPRIGGSQNVENLEGVIVHRFTNQGGKQRTAGRQAAKMAEEIKKLQPLVCHLHGTSLFAWLMYWELKRRRLRVVVTIHGLVLVEKRNALKKRFSAKILLQYLYQGWVEKRFISQLPMAIVDTEYVKSRVEQYPIRRKPAMHVIPQGIDEAFFSVQCSKESRMILSVGAIGERKGHLLTLKAFELAESRGMDAQLVIVGTVAEEGYLKQLKKAIAGSKFSNRISLLPDLSEGALKQLYEKAHLFVLHSEEESQGIVFAEAMATGLPVVSTRVGGVPYVVEHGKNGLLTDYGDVEAFAANMRCMMNDNEKWQSMSKASKVDSHCYHWTNIKNSIMQLYRSVE